MNFPVGTSSAFASGRWASRRLGGRRAGRVCRRLRPPRHTCRVVSSPHTPTRGAAVGQSGLAREPPTPGYGTDRGQRDRGTEGGWAEVAGAVEGPGGNHSPAAGTPSRWPRCRLQCSPPRGQQRHHRTRNTWKKALGTGGQRVNPSAHRGPYRSLGGGAAAPRRGHTAGGEAPAAVKARAVRRRQARRETGSTHVARAHARFHSWPRRRHRFGKPRCGNVPKGACAVVTAALRTVD